MSNFEEGAHSSTNDVTYQNLFFFKGRLRLRVAKLVDLTSFICPGHKPAKNH